MNNIKIWHNAKCSKSRAAMQLLETNKCDADVVTYLEDTPSCEEIKEVINMLKTNARGIMRTKEVLYKELNLSDESLSEEDLVEAMTTNPILIERPIVIKDGRAAIGRPIENIIDLIS
jgi:arsenate reductase